MDIRLTVSLLCSSEYRNDEVINCLYNACCEQRDSAVRAYARMCEILLISGQSLSDHLFELAAGGSLVREYVRSGGEVLRNAAANDIARLSVLSRVTYEEIIGHIYEETVIDGLSDTDPPVYENGDTVIDLEHTADYIRRFGSVFFEKNKAFVCENGALVPVSHSDPVRLSELKRYEDERRRFTENLLCFIHGKPYSSVLLYGDRGTGKSSTVKAAVNEYRQLRMIYLPKSSLGEIYSVYDSVRDCPLKFVIFIDDLTFEKTDESYPLLKQALEGSVRAMPGNCMICATTNRRHIVKETLSERQGDELHVSDLRDENASLSDRFGLFITFMKPDRSVYLDIVKQLAEEKKIDMDEQRLFALAERFALEKNGRSPRTAKQFTDMLSARSSLGFDTEKI